MKRNAFGDPIAQPNDDPWVIYGDNLCIDMSDNLLRARFIEEDMNFDWCCELESEDGTTLSVHNFETREALIEWCNRHNIEVDDD